MSSFTTPAPATFSIGSTEFQAIRDMMYRASGVALSDAKRALVCSRLARRLRGLHLTDFAEYVAYLQASDTGGRELQHMVNCLTTNKTDFFREPHHFDFLRDNLFPELERRAQAGGPRRLRIWSTACSDGDEPYSLAMTVLEHLPAAATWDVRILATDINTEVLATACAGVYPREKLTGVSNQWLHKYTVAAKEGSGKVAIRPDVKRLITFRQLNLMGDWPLRQSFDVIFCRNVLIYFDRATQEKLVGRLATQLSDDGHLMLGHSENAAWLADTFETRGNTIYRRRRAGISPIRKDGVANTPNAPVRTVPAAPAAPVAHRSRRPITGKTHSELPSHNIIAGQTCVLRDPGQITTILGSCVAVCLYDPKSGIGGMNHFMLSSPASDDQASARYGVHAMELLITGIMKAGGDRDRLRAKAFGGADVLGFKNELCQIGNQNVEFVRHFLATEQIPLVAHKLGGKLPLRVHFHPHSGRVFVKSVERSKDLTYRELRFSQDVQQRASTTGDVTLFV